MSLTVTEKGSVSAMLQWLHGLWAYYRTYTNTAMHAASAAALTAFGLLIFIDPRFVVLAIASYLCPPVILYSIGSDIGMASSPVSATTPRTATSTPSDTGLDIGSDTLNGDSDSDSDGEDADSDGVDADTDGADADADSDG